MCGDCEKCGEHALDCKCKLISDVISFTPIEPMIISINKDYFRKVFKKVFAEWEHKLTFGIGNDQQNQLFEELINTMEL